ncbi:hypothetical protein [Rubritalea sp.]|uniref:hypothetical protein n=1 Tax=Rubritalea sp. TaxID=2109375 RepID=UPI003EF3912D
MKTLSIPFSILALTVSPLMAEVVSETPATEEKASPMTIEERKESIVSLEAYIEERDARLQEITEDVLRLDDRLQGKVDGIVNKLASVSDSQDSQYLVSQEKIKVMKELVKSMQNYQDNRAALIRDLRKNDPNVPKEAIEMDVERNNELSEKRVEQVLLLSKSFTQEDPNIKKYTRTGRGGWDRAGNWNSNERISGAYKQNQRNFAMNKKQRDAVKKALDESIVRYETLANGVEDRLKDPNVSPESRELMESELGHYKEVLANRKRQKEDYTLVSQPKTKQISQRAAMDLDQSLDDAMNDFRDDIYHITKKHEELREEQTRIQELKVNLAARQQWLVDYDAGKVQLPSE